MNTKRKKLTVAQRLALLGPVRVPQGKQVPWHSRMGIRANG
jgi:hypothetical protein